MGKPVWVYDIECFTNLFTVTFEGRDDDTVEQFAIHVDDPAADHAALQLWDFCRTQVLGAIGFNNLNYDYIVLHDLLARSRDYCIAHKQELPELLYSKSQSVIKTEYNEMYKLRVPKRKSFFINRDLFLIHHFNNKNKSTSLKDLEVRMRMDSVQDMPFEHYEAVPLDQVDKVLEYNLHDVKATKKFYHEHTTDMLKLRHFYSKKYGIDLRNANDPKIGESIVLYRLAEKLGKKPQELRKMQTNYDKVDVADVIFDDISFTDPKLSKMLAAFKAKKLFAIDGEIIVKETFEYLVPYAGMLIKYAMGGIHGARPQFDSNTMVPEGWMVSSIDVTSYYPRLSVSKQIYPAHLGPAFCEVYDELFHERTQYEKGTIENGGLKLGLNGTFGKMGEPRSWLKDIKALIGITINGQLYLTVLTERINMIGGQVLMLNTDGIEVLHKIEDLDKIKAVVTQWESETGLQMEYDEYKHIWIRDVNNYLAIKPSGKVKEAGAFSYTKGIDQDNSMLVVPLAVRFHLEKGEPVDLAVRLGDMYEYLKMIRVSKNVVFYLDQVKGSERNSITLPRTVRYFVANKTAVGDHIGWLRKDYGINPKTRKRQQTRVEAGLKVGIMNDIRPFEEWKDQIDFQYYYREAMKLIRGVKSEQLQLI